MRSTTFEAMSEFPGGLPPHAGDAPPHHGVPDSAALMAEIEREVRDRRRAGDITPEFELELDRAFAEVAPPGAFGGGFETVVDQAARHAVVDFDAPVTGSRPLRFVKRTVKLLTAWYMIFVGRQLVAFAGTTLRALRLLGGRVDTLEHRMPATDPRVLATLAPVSADADVSEFHAGCTEALRALRGRVVHADCGDGALLVALHAAGIDAYGVDPRPDAAAQADAHGLEVRGDDVLQHLRMVSPGALHGAVLSGCVDRQSLGDHIELVSLAASALRSDGALVVLGSTPDAWRRKTTPVASDLAPGCPLHAETWEYLLARHGFVDVVVESGRATVPQEVATSGDPAVAALGAVVFGPSTFMVRARRQ